MGWEERKTMKASKFSDAKKAFILKQGADGVDDRRDRCDPRHIGCDVLIARTKSARSQGKRQGGGAVWNADAKRTPT